MRAIPWSRRKFLVCLGGFSGGIILSNCGKPDLSTHSAPLPPDAKNSPSTFSQIVSDDGTSNVLEESPTVDLPPTIEIIFRDGDDPDRVFLNLMPAVVDELQCDRTFLYIRDPQRQRTRITHGYSRDNRWPTMVQSGWSAESPSLNSKDPLTASAYQSPEAKFIDDIETASPGTLDLAMERAVFGHRALVHAPIYYEDEFYGILEPCVFDEPRIWTERDRNLIAGLQQVLGRWVYLYLQQVS